MTTIVPGNTNTGTKCGKKNEIRGRAFQFTLNQVDKYNELLEDLKALKTMDYLLSCEEEAPTTGHKHIHIYVHFNQPYRISRKIISYNAHIEVCRGSPKQNIEYIRKDGSILDEIGEVPHQGALTIKDLMELDRDEVPPNMLRTYDTEKRRRSCDIKLEDMLNEIEEDRLEGPEVIYFTGDSGKGKTYSAYKYALNKYDKKDIGKISFNNGFADIVNPSAKCIVCEEFRPADLKASKLLELLDKYGASVNVKGGFEYIRPKTIILASIFNPKYLYNDEEKNEQFTRRIKHVYRCEDDRTEILK